MRHAMRLGFVFVLTFLAGGCESSDPYEAAAEKTVAKAKEMVSMLEGVKTAADVQAAAPKLEAIKKEFEAISAEIKKQPKMTDAQKAKVKKVFDGAKADMDKSSPEAPPMSDNPEAAEKFVESAMGVSLAMMDVMMQFQAQGASMSDLGEPGGAAPTGE